MSKSGYVLLFIYTSRWWRPCVLTILLTSFRLVEDTTLENLVCSKRSKKSITMGSVHGAPRGASPPATQPKWPPLGVTISIQFGFFWGTKGQKTTQEMGKDKSWIIQQFRIRYQSICKLQISWWQANIYAIISSYYTIHFIYLRQRKLDLYNIICWEIYYEGQFLITKVQNIQVPSHYNCLVNPYTLFITFRDKK